MIWQFIYSPAIKQFVSIKSKIGINTLKNYILQIRELQGGNKKTVHETKNTNYLFICASNTCRSPAAAGIATSIGLCGEDDMGNNKICQSRGVCPDWKEGDKKSVAKGTGRQLKSNYGKKGKKFTNNHLAKKLKCSDLFSKPDKRLIVYPMNKEIETETRAKLEHCKNNGWKYTNTIIQPNWKIKDPYKHQNTINEVDEYKKMFNSVEKKVLRIKTTKS